MAPSATEVAVPTEVPILPGKAAAAKPWLKNSAALDQFEHIEVTPVIGREYPTANVVSWLQAPNSDELRKELALISTFSLRGLHARVKADQDKSPSAVSCSSDPKTT
jgi:hypothetical protein